MDRYLTKNNILAIVKNKGDAVLVEFRDERGQECAPRMERESMKDTVGSFEREGWDELQPQYL